MRQSPATTRGPLMLNIAYAPFPTGQSGMFNGIIISVDSKDANVAQLVEQPIRNQQVGGSSPLSSFCAGLRGQLFFL